MRVQLKIVHGCPSICLYLLCVEALRGDPNPGHESCADAEVRKKPWFSSLELGQAGILPDITL